jgi:ABC-type nitrate/sulfonate/bicarbonate transport system substrate-binding protein
MLRRIAPLSIGGAALVVAVAACGSSSSGSASSSSTKSGGTQTSMVSATITAPATEQSFAIWVALAEGFFTKNGVNMKLIPSSSGGSDTIAVVESGSADFSVQDSLVPTKAIEKGATIKYVLMPELSDAQQISISKAAPGASKVEAAPTAADKLKALKGSNYKIGVSTTASSSYSYLYTATHLYGLSTASGGDISINTLGTPQNEIVAINAHKVDGVAGVPPTTTQENTIQIPMDEISPFNEMAGSFLFTSDKFIKSSPKTVQDVVTAMIQACQFIAKNPTQASADVVKAAQAADPTTKTAKEQANFKTSHPHFQNPYPTQNAYNTLQKLTDGTPPAGPYPAYTAAVDPSFAKTAFAKLGIQVPTG